MEYGLFGGKTRDTLWKNYNELRDDGAYSTNAEQRKRFYVAYGKKCKKGAKTNYAASPENKP